MNTISEYKGSDMNTETKIKTCSFTGHRYIPDDKLEHVRQEMRREINQAVADGFTRFISGFAFGADLEFAAIIAEMKKNNKELILEAALPYRGRLNIKETLLNSLVAQCDIVHCNREIYTTNCYLIRNRYLVKSAERVIAVFDGREKSGTAQTIRIAKRLGRELKIIFI